MVIVSVDLSKLIVRERIDMSSLGGKSIAVDAYNTIYQFLTIIRQPDGTPLTDNNGNVTSHLSGLFFRVTELISNGVKPVFVFDGIPSLLKQRTINARMRRRDKAYSKWQEAKEQGNMEEARTRAQQSTRISKEIVSSSKRLLYLMGVPYVEAPSEGEAQASHMCIEKQVDLVGSQDYDTLLFGAPHVVRNLTISGRRKLPRKNIYVNVEPELVELETTLRALGINRRQLIWIGIMLGTDFNEGIKGIGPKTALKIAKASKSLDDMVAEVKIKSNAEFDTDVREVEEMFLKPEVVEVNDDAVRYTQRPDKHEIIRFMCDDHGFSRERIEKFVDKLVSIRGEANQQGIHKWM